MSVDCFSLTNAQIQEMVSFDTDVVDIQNAANRKCLNALTKHLRDNQDPFIEWRIAQNVDSRNRRNKDKLAAETYERWFGRLPYEFLKK